MLPRLRNVLLKKRFLLNSRFFPEFYRNFSSEVLPDVNSKHKAVWKLPRIYLDNPLVIGETVTITADVAHYLANLMRLKEGNPFRAFNGRSGEGGGEYLLTMERPQQTRRMKNLDVVHASVVSQLREAGDCANLPVCLYIAPIRRAKMKLLLEKATELGVGAMGVVQTALVQRGNADRWDMEAYNKVITEACEQSERMTLPHVEHTAPMPLSQLLSQWQRRKDNGEFVRLLVCRERMKVDQGQGVPLLSALLDVPKAALLAALGAAAPPAEENNAQPKLPPFGLMVGPEGGWMSDELELCSKYSVVQMVTLGGSVLRSETAAIAALSVFSSAIDHIKCN